MKKTRLDIELVNRKLVLSRSRAQQLIRAGLVTINNQTAITPAQPVTANTNITITKPLPYVSRGGLKLKHALTTFQIDPTGWTCLDIGASTGGFTDCLLQHGASQVHALDVGTNQLAEPLRHDPRVISAEQTHFNQLDQLPDPLDLVVIDVSFISATKVLLHLQSILPVTRHPLAVILLLKPQFETTPKNLKKGVVRDPKIHAQILADFTQFCADHQIEILGQTTSPLKGPKGNIEYLFHLLITK